MSKHVNNHVMMNLVPIKRAPQCPYEKGEIWVFSSQLKMTIIIHSTSNDCNWLTLKAKQIIYLNNKTLQN